MTNTIPRTLLLFALFLAVGLSAQDTPVYFAPDPGVAKVEVSPSGFSVSNFVLSMNWTIAGGGITALEFKDQLAHRTIPAQSIPFSLILGDGSVIPASAMKMAGAPRVVSLDAHPDAARLAERILGKSIAIEFEDERGRL